MSANRNADDTGMQELPVLAYSARYDAFYEIRTGRWTESNCGDPDCYYCKDRPETANYVEIRAKGVKVGE